MQKKIVKIFIIVFLTTISIPFVFVILQIKVTPVNKQEKKISLNFKRNFPLRSDLFKVYSQGKNNVFGSEPIPNGVVEGKNGWKFLGNKFSNALSESKGLVVFNQKQLSKISKNLLEKKEWLDKQNIKFYFSIAPNKHSIYGNMIPIKKSNRKTKFEQLDSICKSLDIKFIDLGSNFPKNDSLRLYHKTDSHWNHYGAFYAYNSTLEAIMPDFKNVDFNYRTMKDMDIEKFWAHIGDLNRALFLEQNEEFINVKPKKPFSFTTQEKILTVPSNYHFGSHFYEERYKSNANDLKILMLRDSFFGAYFESIADSFGESVFIWRHNFNKELIESEKPDILCYELVERNIDILLTENFNHSPD